MEWLHDLCLRQQCAHQPIQKLLPSSLSVIVAKILNEIGSREDPLSDWAKLNRRVFMQPSIEELAFVSEIFKVAHFQTLVRTEERLKGKPVADPFVIAKSKAIQGCVVTDELLKPNAAKIPNVCAHFGVACLNLEGFMEKENWTF
jgi:hypothetical protein